MRLVVVLLDLFLDDFLDLVRVFEVHRHHAQRVADEIRGEMVLQDLRIVLEDRGVLGVFDVLFDRHHAFCLHCLG